MAAADDDWVYVAEEEASDSDDSYSCYTSAMDDEARSDGGWTEVNGGYAEEGGDDVVGTAACPVPEEAAPAHGIKIDGDHEEAAAIAEDHGHAGGQATDAEAYYYGAYGDGYDGSYVSYGDGGNYKSGQATDAEKYYYGYGYGGGYATGNGDYYGGQATDADAYYNYGGDGYGFSYDSYGSYGYGYGRDHAYGPGPAYGLHGNNDYNSDSARGYGYGGSIYDYGNVQDGAAYQQAPGYDAYAPTKPLEVRLRVPSWPPVFFAAPAVSSNAAPEPRAVPAPSPRPQPRARGITFLDY